MRKIVKHSPVIDGELIDEAEQAAADVRSHSLPRLPPGHAYLVTNEVIRVIVVRTIRENEPEPDYMFGERRGSSRGRFFPDLTIEATQLSARQR